jgi:NAD(P)-dependent dehydrogenase (short-subunit alcohol dehydrogenase family)
VSRSADALAGRRVLITGAARGIGAATAHRLHERGARVALTGVEPELLERVAAECGGAPWIEADVSDRGQIEAAVEELVERLGGLDVVMANAGVAAQLPLVGGDPAVFERTLAVNTLGCYYTLRAAGPHISHPDGYALAVSSLAAAVHPALLGAYSASKAGVEALGDTLRSELRHTGAKVGVAYFAELDTDMTHRGFGTKAAKVLTRGGRFSRVAPLESGIDAIERGIARRSRRVVAPPWVGPLLPARMVVQRVVELATRSRVAAALEIALGEAPELTTPQADRGDRTAAGAPEMSGNTSSQ